MVLIRGLGPVPAPASGVRPVRAPSSFRLPSARSAAAGPAAGVEEVGLAGMLALQELPDWAAADRDARRRGQDLLTALAEMQRAMLGLGDGDPARLERLAASAPMAADPGLRDVVAAIALRARIEAARLCVSPEDDSRNSIESS